jgi:hypothetical protein
MSQSQRRAVVTMVRNESVFFPIWLGYYSRFFPPDAISVLDDGTSDGSTDGDGFVRIPVSSEHIGRSASWDQHTIEEFQPDLIRRYDVVLCTDVDEIIAPDWFASATYSKPLLARVPMQ